MLLAGLPPPNVRRLRSIQTDTGTLPRHSSGTDLGTKHKMPLPMRHRVLRNCLRESSGSGETTRIRLVLHSRKTPARPRILGPLQQVPPFPLSGGHRRVQRDNSVFRGRYYGKYNAQRRDWLVEANLHRQAVTAANQGIFPTTYNRPNEAPSGSTSILRGTSSRSSLRRCGSEASRTGEATT